MDASNKTPASPIEIYLAQTLGMGSYGLVCKAKCGKQPCAAKVLHQSLFQLSSGSNDYIAKFQKECQFLSAIRHPNIVQHLGTTKDPGSGRPVLLMELMDESLTHHLEHSTQDLSYHSQVNIGYDIALALSYLHTNTIIHRDLSSNNILLIGEGCTAKVTDFGLYKLIDANPYASPLSLSQGTLAYMPPEVLILPPNYSSAMDCFSLGVLLLQIITRNYPEPGDAHMYVEHADQPSSRVVLQIPEAKRRKRDIDLIQPSHPLRSTALDCLKDREEERPSADDICQQFASLKMDNVYTESVKGLSQEKILQEQVEAKEKVIGDLQAQIQTEAEKHRNEIDALKEDLEKTKQLAEEYHLKTEEKENIEKVKFQEERKREAEQHKKEVDELQEELTATKQLMEENTSKSEKNEATQRRAFELEVDSKTKLHTREMDRMREKLAAAKNPTEEHRLELEKTERQPQEESDGKQDELEQTPTNTEELLTAEDNSSVQQQESSSDKDLEPVCEPVKDTETVDETEEPGPATASDFVEVLESVSEAAGEPEEMSETKREPTPATARDSTKELVSEGEAAEDQQNSMKEAAPEGTELEEDRQPAGEGEITKEVEDIQPAAAITPMKPEGEATAEDVVPEPEVPKEMEEPQPSADDTVPVAEAAKGPQLATANDLMNSETEPPTEPEKKQEPKHKPEIMQEKETMTKPVPEKEPPKAQGPQKKRTKSLIKKKEKVKKQAAAKQQEPEPPKKKKLWKRFSKTDLNPDTQKEKSAAQLPLRKEDPPLGAIPPLPVATLKWRQGKPSPDNLGSLHGTALVHKDTVYVARHFDIYSYHVAKDEWDKLPTSAYQSFSMAVIENQLTTIGGISRDQTRTNRLYSLVGRSNKEWEELYPPIPTHRVCSAALNTPTHLIVAGGRDRAELCTIEVMSRENYQWSQAANLPEPMGSLQMVLCLGQLYICMQQVFYSYSLEKLLQSSYEAPDTSNGNRWTKLTDIPTYSGYCLSCLGDELVVVGGCNDNDKETAAIHGYDPDTATWLAKGEMPTARIDTLATPVTLDAQELVVVMGGWTNSNSYNITEIGTHA